MKYLILFFSTALLLLSSCAEEGMKNPIPPIDCNAYPVATSHSLQTEVQSILIEYIDKGLPGMTILLSNSEGLLIESAGYSDVANQVDMVECNSYFSGSVAKMYTVTAAMSLYENGMFNLDDKIAPYLSEELVSQLPNAQEATIRHLMNHSAGMPDHDDEEALSEYIERNEGRLPSAEDQLAYLFDNNPRFEPGSTADYSSAHTLTLSIVLDQIIGAHHSDLISESIIDRLGLAETYYKNETGYPAPFNLVKGYLGSGSSIDDISLEASNYALGSQGDAGIIATAMDYYLFMKGLVDGRVVSTPTLSAMLGEPMLYDDGTHGFGFGLGVFLIAHNRELAKWGHSGATLGGMSHVYYYPQTDTYLVVLTNTILEDEIELLTDWSGSIFVNTGSNYLLDKLEGLFMR